MMALWTRHASRPLSLVHAKPPSSPRSSVLSAYATLAPCPVCGSRSFREKFGPIKQCRGCGLGMVNPLGDFPGENETEDYFVREYLPLLLVSREASRAERRSHIAAVSRRFALPAAPRHLDIGCALGFMLEESRRAGWNPVGVETSAFAARYAAEHTGCPVHAGTLEQAALPAASFDVVTLTDVIEHVPQPSGLLAEIYRVLRPGGVLLIVTPNFGSLFVRLYGLKAYGMWPDQHVIYFSRSSMTRLLRDSGFRRVLAGSKDFYAENLRRLWPGKPAPSEKIKQAFGKQAGFARARDFVNGILLRVPIGDKLLALAQK